jgi:hypothetical protein
LPPGVSKLINTAKYRHFDFDMGFVTALHASTAGFERGVGDVTKTDVFDIGHKKNLNHADRVPRLPLLATLPPLTHTS